MFASSVSGNRFLACDEDSVNRSTLERRRGIGIRRLNEGVAQAGQSAEVAEIYGKGFLGKLCKLDFMFCQLYLRPGTGSTS